MSKKLNEADQQYEDFSSVLPRVNEPNAPRDILTRLYLDGIADGGTGGGMDEAVENALADIQALIKETSKRV